MTIDGKESEWLMRPAVIDRRYKNTYAMIIGQEDFRETSACLKNIERSFGCARGGALR